MLEIIGAVRKDGRAACKACGCRLPEKTLPGFIWAHGSFSYEEYFCPECRKKIFVMRTGAAR